MAKEAREVPGEERTPTPADGQAGAAERRCQVCDLKLSAYNPGPNCWAHTIGFPWRGPTAKPRF